MILSTIVLVGSLLAVTVSGSAIKGREEYASKVTGRQIIWPVAVGHQQLRPHNYEQQHHEPAYAATKGQEVRRTDEVAEQQTRLADLDTYQQSTQQREEIKSERQQFYEAQPQLRNEEQTRLEDYHQTQQQHEDVARQEVKSVVRQETAPGEFFAQQQRQQVAETKYEARPQVREEASQAPVVAAAAKGPVYSKTEERRDEQVQYQAASPSQVEQKKLVQVEEVQQRVEEVKGQRVAYESVAAQQREETKSSQVNKASAAASSAAAATVQRIEEQKFEQEHQLQEQQQAVELTKQEHYEQRRFEEQTEQRAEEQVVQVREEAGGLKGGLRQAGAEAEPYAFDYSVEGSSRRESGDQYGVVRGQYTIQNPDGSQRVVDYVADRDGFRAQVQTNEFGTEAQHPANVALRSSQQPSAEFAARLDTKSSVVYAAPAPAPAAPAPIPVPAVVAAAPIVVPLAAPAIKSAPPQPVVQVAEVARAKSYVETSQQVAAASVSGAYKGAPAADQSTYHDGGQQQQAAPSTAYKGQRASDEYQQRQTKSAFAKSAELRAAPDSTEPLLARASSFESATAHRPVVHSVVHSVVPTTTTTVVRHLVPAPPSVVQPVVRHHLPPNVPVAPGRRDRHPHQQHQHQHYRHHHHQSPSSIVPVAVSRSQLQHDRYPPTLRRHDHLAAALNPRVSFYANSNNFDDEQPAGFEHPAEPIL